MTIVPDDRDFVAPLVAPSKAAAAQSGNGDLVYMVSKRAFDLVFATIVLLPATLIVAIALLVLNPFINKGPLIHVQKRMGRDCKPFRAYKFRSMFVQPRGMRGPDDPIEVERITLLGNLLRRSRFDELPQIWNVYRGEMSLIGPRPDYFRHACHYVRVIPGYRARHNVRPGISGLAQIKHGYAAGLNATRLKTSADLIYIRQASLRLDLWIFWRTVVTVFRMRGA
ncbi:sugar transferase [Roseicyclus mahoneyensis]|uniref:Lipopolysaccharide/colanic/teichoic acid biosynthesis glycosyltransferase n=1 Tax=Roseicyclus mahoneyensis TaxID=164332 RepID=A0A316GIF2_9RHOB|nr:sugar transferase [Roseicyclus mahoneyensis]PWK60560.1 lipopolysaccharide/colanic/teichoic acid biosynthesis glycosyltransferase [Roseicyclus mahoneyensis]